MAILIAAAAAVIAIVVLILVSTLTVPEAQDLTIESSSSAQVLSWKGKPNKITYLVYRKTGDTDYELVSTVAEGAEPTFVSRDLQSATLYDYKVVAVKEIGGKPTESKGQTASAYTLPVTITDVKARTMSKDSLTLTFTDSQPVDNFEIRYGASQDLTEPEVLSVPYSKAERNEADHTCSVTIPNQKEGTVLYYSIRSVCGEDIFSEWSDVFSGTVTRAIDMTGIDTTKPMVALTFDDGPDKGEFTTRILEAIEAAGGHGTFFQLGQLVESFPEISKRIVSGGHQIACHTYDHEHMGDAVTSEDITKANDAIQEVTGVRPSAFRCPGGELTDLIRSTCESEGQAIFYWWLDTRDWSSRDADSVVSEIQNHVADGDIILMHNIYGSTAEAVERIVPWLANKGYQLVTVDQLIQAKTGEPPMPGVQYFSGTDSDANKKADK